jgi:hypothetical protein
MKLAQRIEANPEVMLGKPGLQPHPLKGDRRGTWSVRVNGNWRAVRPAGPSLVANPRKMRWHQLGPLRQFDRRDECPPARAALAFSNDRTLMRDRGASPRWRDAKD